MESCVTAPARLGHVGNTGPAKVEPDTVALLAHQGRAWALGRVPTTRHPTTTPEIGLLESFGLAWKILLWGIHQYGLRLHSRTSTKVLKR